MLNRDQLIYFGVALVAAALYIPFLGAVHLFDWDEINFAESAREMLVSGEYFRVQINFQPFWEKPPLFFWLQAAAMSVFGVGEFAARFPNAISGILTLVLLYHIGRTSVSSRFGLLWVLFMAGSFTPSLYFKSGIIDPWFNLFIFFGIWQISRASMKKAGRERLLHFVLASSSLGLAVLTKGPVALLVTALCLIVFVVRNGFYLFFNWKEVIIGMVIILGISSLWVALEMQQNGMGVLADFITYQIDLFKNPVAGHGQPWYYHSVVLLFGAFPASLFAIQGFLTTAKRAEEKVLKQWMSLLFWVVLILFSSVTTKIVHYSSLCWMPLAFMSAYGVEHLLQQEKAVSGWLRVMLSVIGLVLGILLTLVPLVDQLKPLLFNIVTDTFTRACLSIPSPWNGWEWTLGIGFLLVLVTSLVWMKRGKLQQGVVLLTGSIALLIPAYMVAVVPKIEAYSQAPAIRFYESVQDQDCYVEVLGMKSYAQYFYGRCKPQANPQYTNINWLLEGAVDKPVYFVSKVHRETEMRNYGLKLVDREGGFMLWIRPDSIPNINR